MPNPLRFRWGALGVIAVEISRFIPVVSQGTAVPHLHWSLYCALQVFSACIGGAFAIAWETNNTLKSIWIGASWPAILATLVQATPSIPK